MTSTTTWAIVGVGLLIGLLLMTAGKHPLVKGKPSTRIPKVKPSSPTRTPGIIQVSAEQPTKDLGSCQCVNGVLTGPQCKVQPGMSCSWLSNMIKASNNCQCVNGVLTGYGCPEIGRTCSFAPNIPRPDQPGPYAIA